MEGREGILSRLAQIHAGLAVLNADDTAALIPLGAALEEIAGDAPEEPEDVSDVLYLVLQALQALFEGDAPDSEAVLVAARGAIAAAMEAVREPASESVCAALCAASDRLSEALDPGAAVADSLTLAEEGAVGESVGGPEQSAVSTPVPATLDSLAIDLMLLDLSVPTDVQTLHGAIERVLREGDLPAKARECLSEARARVERVSAGENSDPAQLHAEVSGAIEQAMSFIDEFAPPSVAEPSGPDDAEPDAAALGLPEVSPGEPVMGMDEPSVSLLPADSDAALLAEFITECRDLLDGAEAALLALELDPGDAESINTVFRAFHTIKGTSGFLGINTLSDLAHEAETLLSRMRDGEIRCVGGYADLALRCLDTLKDLIRGVEDALNGAPTPLPAGLADLRRALADPDAAVASAPAAQPVVPSIQETEQADATEAGGQRAETRPVRAALPQQDASVRVRMDRLDSLIEMVGELVIAQSMVAQDPSVVSGMHYDLSRKVGHAGKIVRELQDLSLSMRMVPLKPTFQKMTRLVRDLAHKSGKTVSFSTDGEDTEIDRNMVDLINDPLVHLIRNAVDHGIEPPDARAAAGKPREGTVRLSAYHSSGNVVVEVRDDGRGLDPEKIIARAVSRGLIEAGRSMTDREAYDLIFTPGFSTVDQVTEISGRGVGMDVVRRSVESLQGRIVITSELGKGCTFALRVPMTLAITDGMLVRVGEERYIIPTTSIHLCYRPDAGSLSTVTGRGEMVLLRENLMPVFRLHRLFGIAGAIEDPTQGLLVVIGNEGRQCALLVDELLGQQQVVAKSLGSVARQTPGISGGAILGDGRVGLILDTVALIALAQTTDAAAPRREMAVR